MYIQILFVIDNVIKAINYAEINGAKVCSMSFGTNIYSEELQNTVKQSKMLFVVSAGNDGYDIDGELQCYPASYKEENIITVASMRSDGKIDCTSNYGVSSVDLVAPGTDIVSVNSKERFAYYSGTSYAVPFVSGTAAKLFSLNKNDISALEVKRIILDNVKVSIELEKYVKTSGVLNEKAAIENGLIIK